MRDRSWLSEAQMARPLSRSGVAPVRRWPQRGCRAGSSSIATTCVRVIRLWPVAGRRCSTTARVRRRRMREPETAGLCGTRGREN